MVVGDAQWDGATARMIRDVGTAALNETA